MRRVLVIMMLVSHGIAFAGTLSGEEILRRVDENFTSESRIFVSTMIISGRRGTRTVKAKTWAEGSEKVFTNYLAPAREKDTKMLKLKDELWTWSPAADRIIKIAGHMLRQPLLGSDISYEDFMEDPELGNTYDSKVTGEENIEGRPCYILELNAREDGTAYYSRRLWVDTERFLPLREERYARSGKLIKSVIIQEVFQVKERWYPKRITFRDTLKKGDGTLLVIDSIEFDVPIPGHFFTKASLRR